MDLNPQVQSQGLRLDESLVPMELCLVLLLWVIWG